MKLHEHWEEVYQNKEFTDLPWFSDQLTESLALIEEAHLAPQASIIDVGSGSSLLPDLLLERGFRDITLLDLSSNALGQAKRRLGERGQDLTWICRDLLEEGLGASFDLWHDRALFHFMVEEERREIYLKRLRAHLKPGGFFLFGAFSTEGPERCSGLPVRRYDSDLAQETLGKDFRPVRSIQTVHTTPKGVEQNYRFFLFHYQPQATQN